MENRLLKKDHSLFVLDTVSETTGMLNRATIKNDSPTSFWSVLARVASKFGLVRLRSRSPIFGDRLR